MGFKSIFLESISVSCKSLLTLLWIYLGWVFFVIILGSIASLMGGKEVLAVLFAAVKNPAALNVTQEQSSSIFLWGLFILSTFYLTCFWAILVIRNRILLGKSLIIDAFIEFCKKIWRIIFTNLILMFVNFAALIITGLLFKKGSSIIFLLFLLFTGPMYFTILYGVLFQSGKFWKIIGQNISLAYHNWLKITVNEILLQLVMALFIIAVTFLGFVFEILGISIVGSLTEIILPIIFATFLPCFATVLYLNVSDLKPQETAFKQNVTKIITRSNQNML
jgi:hypothetical protein